ncbi:glycosyltransferase [Microbaculum marinum]|uniref:Glycosyltransferase n=1 Tax=Microbaculum marinum TaxID=1764581 RepID=A0AAW9RXU5_9HYPH
MHVHLLTLGSRGDVQPYVALGATLLARGHKVTVTTGRGFDELIEDSGLVSAPISMDVRSMLGEPVVREALDSLSGKVRAFRAMKAETLRQIDETCDRIVETDADVLVFHQKMGVAPTVAAKLGVPAVASFLLPGMVATSAFPFPLIPAASLGAIGNRLSHRLIGSLIDLSYTPLLRRWHRHRYGDTDGLLQPFDGYDPAGRPPLRLHAFSRHIVPRPEDWDRRDKVTGYWFEAAKASWASPAGLERFLGSGPPPVYVGFGSMPSADSSRLTGIVVEALQRAGMRGLLATNWGSLESTSTPDTVHIIETAPHSWLFPRCAAVVHHGGAGTTHEGLRWGRPTVVCPVGVDQPFWGRRVAKLGVGPQPIPLKKLTPDSLAVALRQTKDRKMDERAARLGEEIRTEGGTEVAADLVEAWIAR